MHETLFSDIIFAAEATVSSEQTVITSLLITFPTVSGTHSELVKLSKTSIILLLAKLPVLAGSVLLFDCRHDNNIG
jgi:hypothetical protein